LPSPAGDAFLVVSGSSQPKVYDRDGHELGELPKGDMYIRDATHTKGHQYRCCGGAWHPDERCAFRRRPARHAVLLQD
jgi:WD repeat-containing protein 70